MCNAQTIPVCIKFGKCNIESSDVIVVVFTSSTYYKDSTIMQGTLNEIRNKYSENLPLVFIVIDLENITVEFSSEINNKESIRKCCIDLGVEYWMNCSLKNDFKFGYYQN